jgi:PelA/Pel-15E family pectate lyase
MVQTLQVIRDLRDGKEPFGDLVDDDMKERLSKAFDKGIDCILNTQIIVNGKRTVWCQQHDHVTLKPAPARSFELASYCSSESAALVKLLMEVPHPDKRIRDAVDGAMEWFENHKIMGIRVESYRAENGRYDRRVVNDPQAGPIWARYYDFDTEQPFFCDRDGVPRKTLSEIGYERRNGYGWYSDAPATLYKQYAQWKAVNH